MRVVLEIIRPSEGREIAEIYTISSGYILRRGFPGKHESVVNLPFKSKNRNDSELEIERMKSKFLENGWTAYDESSNEIFVKILYDPRIQDDDQAFKEIQKERRKFKFQIQHKYFQKLLGYPHDSDIGRSGANVLLSCYSVDIGVNEILAYANQNSIIDRFQIALKIPNSPEDWRVIFPYDFKGKFDIL